ncbi:RNA ligase family protein [Spirosoma sp. BT702]|uniref:RNA ligase family protein n=1 Tax=Spirosoma profusum TaxID=2771354 RepID=A0A927AMQ3_9BACT|nr:RNA ligase family protein [Spirosoma profusum]MBD2700274.1 RNA ligase family protein [Spirosoma profusum]
MISRKYGRTYHYPFSPGTTSDDRINHYVDDDISRIQTLVHTEKLDGENNCLNRYGVFARSHAAPTDSPWTRHLRDRWAILKYDLGDLEVFGENLYAVHSIVYPNIDAYFYVFAIREIDQWLSWEETQFYAQLLDFPTVPVLALQSQPFNVNALETDVRQWASEPGVFGSYDALTGEPCTREGVVSRNADSFSLDAHRHNVFKYVRKGHVKTDEHWTRDWKRARLLNEQPE